MEINRKWLSVSMVFLAIAMAILATTSSVAAQSATRTLPDSVAPGETFEVRIEATDYGMAGQVIETLPDGFSYVNSSLSPSQVTQEDQTVKFTLFGETSFTYNVTAPSVEGTFTFSGILKDFQKNEYKVEGDTEIAVKSISITFIPPTPENGTEITVDYVNVTVFVEALNPISTVWLNWNGVNRTMYIIDINTWSYEMTNLTNGEYSYVVYANDTAGNLGVSESRVVTVNVPEFDPWSYDTNGDGKIDKDEAIAAVLDYFAGKITKEQVIEVILLYFSA